MMTIEIDSSSNADLAYLFEEIRSNLLTINDNETTKETPRAHAWLLTTLAFFGDQFNVLIDLYRLFREQHSYILLAFIIEHILQHHSNETDKNRYLQQEFQLIFAAISSRSVSESDGTNQLFSYSRLYSLLSLSTRETISSILTRKWRDELDQYLSFSPLSSLLLLKCREKALACLSLPSCSSSSILLSVLNGEEKAGFKFGTSLNVFRRLFVQDLLPVALRNRHTADGQSHTCHTWLIHALEFYTEYLVICSTVQTTTNAHVRLEGSDETFQCDNPWEQIDSLISLAVTGQQNFNWQQFISRSRDRRQQLLELRNLLDCARSNSSNATVRCPLECFVFCTSFPIFLRSILILSSLLMHKTSYKDHVLIHSTTSIKISTNDQLDDTDLEFIEHFHLFIECLDLLQQSHTNSCLKLYQVMIDKIHLSTSLPGYERLLRLYYYYSAVRKTRIVVLNEAHIEETNRNKTITIDDTPQSPTNQEDPMDESSTSLLDNSPLHAIDLDSLIRLFETESHRQSFECRLQLCSLYSLSSLPEQRRLTVPSCIDTLVFIRQNDPSQTTTTTTDRRSVTLSISTECCFIRLSYKICFDYLLDLLVQHLPPSFVLHQSRMIHFPKTLFHSISPSLLRFIYDRILLGQWLRFIQNTTTTNERRWSSDNNKRKFDAQNSELTDEEFIEKIIQHVSTVAQWTDEQRRDVIYSYLVNERHTFVE